jgi:hypothetical protein
LWLGVHDDGDAGVTGENGVAPVACRLVAQGVAHPVIDRIRIERDRRIVAVRQLSVTSGAQKEVR